MTMKKKILSAAVLAALGAGTAQAVNLSTDGTGQGLLFPYYTVQGGEETILSVVNTTDRGKAVKIRFREAYNSREVLDFNIYLSPYDVWTGKIQDSDTGGAEIVSNDKSCTVPISISQGVAQPFRTFGYDGGAPVAGGKDTGPQGYERTNEGYVEILEMGVTQAANTAVWGSPPYYLHNDGVPEDCAAIQANFGGVWKSDKQAGFGGPQGGLFGAVAVINVQSGTEVSVNATALEDLYEDPQHADTGTLKPSLSDSTRLSSVFYNQSRYDVAIGDEDEFEQRAIKVDDVWRDGLDAVSAVLMADHVMNEYTVNPNVGAETAWIVTFPTKWGYTDSISGVDSGRGHPFTAQFDAVPYGKACEKIGVTAWDREEAEITPSDIDFSPSPETPGIELCYEANVIQFGESDVMSAENTVLTYTSLPGKNGWMSIDMGEDPVHQLNSGITNYIGLPVIGFMSSQLANANVGVGAAYGTSNPHVYHRTISGSGLIDEL
jgi:hypothetical protein